MARIVIKSDSEINKASNYQDVRELAKQYQLNREQIRHILGISESTQFRYEKSNPTLRSNLVDRWSRFVRLLQLADELFDEIESTQQWLASPKQALAGKTPLEIVNTDSGVRQVEQMLLQASYGVFA